MRKYFVIVFLSIFNIVNGQVNVDEIEGFIVKNNGDTIHGTISCYPYYFLMEEVCLNTVDSILKFYPSDINCYEINNVGRFESISIQGSEKEKENITFVRVLQKGEVDLMVRYFKRGKETLYIRNNEFGLSELKQNINTADGIKQSNDYFKRTLGKYTYKYPNVQSGIEECSFRERSISSLIEEYNMKFDVEQYSYTKAKINFDLSVISDFDYYLGEKIRNDRTALGYSIGIKNSFYYKRKSMSLEFATGLNYRYLTLHDKVLKSYTSGFINSVYSTGQNTNFNQNEYISYKVIGSMVELPLYIHYNNKNKLISPILNMGYKFYLIKGKFKLEEGSDDFSTDFEFASDFIFSTGLAINYNKFSIQGQVHLVPYLLTSIGIEYRIKY